MRQTLYLYGKLNYIKKSHWKHAVSQIFLLIPPDNEENCPVMMIIHLLDHHILYKI